MVLFDGVPVFKENNVFAASNTLEGTLAGHAISKFSMPHFCTPKLLNKDAS
tara:strand:- start:92 stop:244 length:153 start_codon:yes stop_codon:yes gene_type:complete